MGLSQGLTQSATNAIHAFHPQYIAAQGLRYSQYVRAGRDIPDS